MTAAIVRLTERFFGVAIVECLTEYGDEFPQRQECAVKRVSS